ALVAGRFPNLPGLAPSVLLSRIKRRMHISPQRGLTNARLLCHAPLVIPENCWIRVGNQVRTWTPGELLIFDDSVEHEAKNDSSETRLVLIFDIWRPELTEEERNFVRHLFGAIESFG
ncbi:MAG: aspartyl/asparaginyl beta-hydroxylase domain-containing protein, partial [Maricaulaceae bacterium]